MRTIEFRIRSGIVAVGGGRFVAWSFEVSTGIFGLLSSSNHQRDQYHHWQGRSGQWWITTVYPLVGSHTDAPSVYVMVHRDSSGKANPLYIGQAENTARRMREHSSDKLFRVLLLGGNELHLHFLAKSEAERFSVETDLRNGHATPLNWQPTEAAGLAGLFQSKAWPGHALGLWR